LDRLRNFFAVKIYVPNSLKSRYAHSLCSAALTVALLTWALHDVSPQLVWNGVKSARFEWLALSVLAFLASFAVRALRWGTLLRAYPDAGFKIRHSATFIGFAGNCIFPARVGELVRATVLHRYTKVPFATALGSIIAERALDVLVLFAFLLVSFPRTTQSTQADPFGLQVSWIGTLVITVCGALVVIARRPNWITQAVEQFGRSIRFQSFKPRLINLVNLLLNGIVVFRSPKQAARAVVEGLIMWALIASAYWFAMFSFGITSPGMTGAVFVLSIVALGIALPSSPGHFGPFEAAIRIALGVYAVPTEIIAAFALTLHFLMYASVTTIGITLAMRLGLSWSEITQSLSKKDEKKR